MVLANDVNFNDAVASGGHIGPWTHCTICEISDRDFCYTRLPDNGDYRSMPWGYCDCAGLPLFASSHLLRSPSVLPCPLTPLSENILMIF